MSIPYTPTNKRRVELVYDSGCVFIHGSRIADRLADVIMKLPADEEVTCNLHLDGLIQSLGETRVGSIQQVVAAADDKQAATKMFSRALLAGLHPDAAVKVVAFGEISDEGYVCPNCGDIHSIEIAYESYCALVQSERGELEGTDDSRVNGGREWSSSSFAQCTNCSFGASLADFDASEPYQMLKRRLRRQQRGIGGFAGQAWKPSAV